MKPRTAPCGTRTRYQTGCRCEPCREASREYAARWRARNRAAGYVFVRGRRRPFDWKNDD